MPFVLRPSGRKARPARHAAATLRRTVRRPAIEMEPEASGRAPTISSRSSVLPAPTRPKRPRISPCRNWKLTGPTYPPSETVSDGRAHVDDAGGGLAGGSRSRSKARPVISTMMVDRVASDAGRSLTSRPSRSTTIRSAMAATSSSRWLMKTIARPWRASPRIDAEQRLDLGRRQRARRLVEKNQLGSHAESFADLDRLLVGYPQPSGRRQRVDVAGPHSARSAARPRPWRGGRSAPNFAL